MFSSDFFFEQVYRNERLSETLKYFCEEGVKSVRSVDWYPKCLLISIMGERGCQYSPKIADVLFYLALYRSRQLQTQSYLKKMFNEVDV